MRISFKRKNTRIKYGIAIKTAILFATAIVSLLITLLLSGQIIRIPSQWPFSISGLLGQIGVESGGVGQWGNDNRLMIPSTNKSTVGTTSFAELSLNFSSYLTSLGPNVGVVAYDLTRQHTYVYNGSTAFIAASSVKVPIMLTFLDLVERQGREPTDDEMVLLTEMIENSNNDAASILYVNVGSATGVAQYMQKIGVHGLIPNDDAWGYSTITPQAMVDLLTLLQNGEILNRNHCVLALDLMKNIEPDQRVGVGDTAPQNAIVAMKDGWVTDDDDLWAVNSSGIVTAGKKTYIVSVYTQKQVSLDDGQAIAKKVCSTIASLLI
jgi:beta-lactamase class A